MCVIRLFPAPPWQVGLVFTVARWRYICSESQRNELAEPVTVSWYCDGQFNTM